MGYSPPTIDDFKAQFARDFPFAVPSYGARGLAAVVSGGIASVTLTAPGTGYSTAPAVAVTDKTGTGVVVAATIANGAVTGFTVSAAGTGYVAPTIVVSGGSGSATDDKRIMDADITGALLDASFNVNGSLFADQARYTRASCYLAAHCLVERLRAAGEGMRSQFSWLVEDKGAGDVKVKYAIPPSILKSPFLAAISTTRYGARYLEIVTPLLVGNMAAFHRQTIP